VNLFPTPLTPPFLFIFFSLMTGIASGNYCPDSKSLALLVLSGLSCLLILTYCFHKRFVFILFLFIVFCLGYLSIQMKLYPALPEDHISRFMDIKKSVIKGKIVSFARHYEKKIKVTIQCENIMIPDQGLKKAIGRIDLSIYLSSGAIPRYGDMIEFESTLHSVHNFGNPGAFDYVRHFKLMGLSATAYCDQKKIKIINDNESKGILVLLLRNIEQLRINFYNFILDHTGHSESGKTLASLITGKTELITPDLRELFSKSGISHLFAISGLHLSIIGFLFFTAIFYLLSISPKYLITGRAKKTAGIITIIPLLLYCIFSGFSPSTQRAFIMAIVLLFSFISEKEKDVLSSLSIAGSLILLIDSSALFSISFQLSFIAVTFIICGLPLIKTFDLLYKNNLLKQSILLLYVSFLASLGTSPMTAHYFHIVSVAQLISNLFFIPLIGFVVLPLGIVSLLCFSLLAAFSGWIINICHLLILFSIHLSKAIISIPFSWFRIMMLDRWEIIFIYLLFIFIYAVLTRKMKLSIGFIIPIILLSIYNFSKSIPIKKPNEVLTITGIDVGQGNSSLIQTPQGHNVLVDGGGFSEFSAFDTGEFILAPFLWRNKINTLDYIILSHPESDHINGLIYILKNFKVHTLIKNTDMTKSEAYETMIKLCRDNGVRIWNPSIKGETLYLGETGLLFFENDEKFQSSDLNNNSLVFKISYKDFSMLFPGDILSVREKRLVNTNSLNLQSEILFSPHHGSSSSSTEIFLDKVLPKSVIVSCGRNNRYKFPHPGVLKRYEDMGIQIFRIDRDGAVFISTNGREYHIKTHKGG